MRIDNLEQRLKAHVIGQDEAINQVGQAIRRSQTGARNPNRPLASFLFDGASGVGKTKLAQAVAIEFYGYQGSEFYGYEGSLARVDMGGFMAEKQFLSLFTGPISRNRGKVILFCEIEKAPPAIARSILQIIDCGEFEFPWNEEDGVNLSFPSTLPRTADFRNAVIIMTSNIGHRHVIQRLADSEVRQGISRDLTGIFRAQLLCRIDEIVLFRMLAKEDLMRMVEVMARELADRMKKSKSVGVEVTDELKNRVITVGRGAKELKWAFSRLVEDPLADRFLKDDLHPGSSVTVGHDPFYESLFSSPASASGI